MTSYGETVGSTSKHWLQPYGYNKQEQRAPSPTSSNNSTGSRTSSCGSTTTQDNGGKSSTCHSLVVAPSPSTLERHSQVRNSVLQKGLRPAPLLEQKDENTTSTTPPQPLMEVESSEDTEEHKMATKHSVPRPPAVGLCRTSTLTSMDSLFPTIMLPRRTNVIAPRPVQSSALFHLFRD